LSRTLISEGGGGSRHVAASQRDHIFLRTFSRIVARAKAVILESGPDEAKDPVRPRGKELYSRPVDASADLPRPTSCAGRLGLDGQQLQTSSATHSKGGRVLVTARKPGTPSTSRRCSARRQRFENSAKQLTAGGVSSCRKSAWGCRRLVRFRYGRLARPTTTSLGTPCRRRASPRRRLVPPG